MAAIFPVATSRVSDFQLQQRVLTQFNANRQLLLRLQDQISSGYRLSQPSDDAAAALRAISLQRLLEQKAQAKTNLQTTQSFLSASDSALSSVADVLTSVRAQAIAMVNTINSDSQRETAAFEIQQAIRQLVDTANQQFRGRYLFAGAMTGTVPFTFDGNYVTYNGSEALTSSFADIDLLVESGVSGHQVFGAYSAGVAASFAWSPNLTEDTRLVSLNGGAGVSRGSLRISDGTNTSVVDLSSAETIRDVIRLIEANPPAGRFVTVRIDGQALDIDIDDAGGGVLTVVEVGHGTTAADLGLYHRDGTGTGRLDGRDLRPVLTPTTRLADMLGQRANAYLESPGGDNDIVIEALARGSEFNDYSFQYVDDWLLQAADGLAAGNETVDFSSVPVAARAALSFSGLHNDLVLTATAPGTQGNGITIEVVDGGSLGNAALVNYDAVARRLTVAIDSSNGTTIQAVRDAINAEGTFTAAYDASDVLDGGFLPTATVSSSDVGNTTGDTGNSGGDANTYFIRVRAGSSSANQVLNALAANADFTSRFQARLEEKDNTALPQSGVGKVGTSIAQSHGGRGGEPDLASGIRLVNGGRTYAISLAGAETVEDLLNTIQAAGAGVLAEISSDGSRIQIRSRISGTDFQIGENGGSTASDLGIRSFTRDTLLSDLNHGRGVSPAPTGGTDFTITRKDGVALPIRLTGTQTVGDVIDLINNHPDNLDPATRVEARLAQFGNGIELVDANVSAPGSLTISHGESVAAFELGWIPRGEQQVIATPSVPGAADQITGADVNPLEVQGIFSTLTRLHHALRGFDVPEIERAVELLTVDFDRLNFARAELGYRQQALDTLDLRLDAETVELKATLSREIDVDLVDALSNLTSLQASIQASLQLIGRTLQMSLMDYL